MRLTTGIPAPTFELDDIEGNPVSLASYQGRKIYLILSRFAACPFCSLRLQDVARVHKSYSEAGVDTLVIFPSKERRVRQFQAKYEPPFRMAADPEQEVFRAFGSETSWAGEIKALIDIPKIYRALADTKMNPAAIDDAVHRMPSEYLINPNGEIAHVHYGAKMDDGFPAQEVLSWATHS